MDLVEKDRPEVGPVISFAENHVLAPVIDIEIRNKTAASGRPLYLGRIVSINTEKNTMIRYISISLDTTVEEPLCHNKYRACINNDATPFQKTLFESLFSAALRK